MIKKILTTLLIFFIFITPALVPMSVSAAGISSLSKGLVGHWMLDGKTKAKDLTPQGNNGTGQGSITIGGATDQKGQANKATTFDGANDNINVGSNTTLNNLGYGTWSAWIYPTSFSDHTYHTVIAKKYNTGFWFGLYDTTGRVQLWVGGTAFQSTGAVSLNQWSHISATWDGSNIKFYINGALDYTVAQSGSAVTNSLSASIGMDTSSSEPTLYQFTGKMSDVRVYNRALSSTEITSLYQTYKPRVAVDSLQQGLVGQWLLDSGSKAKDKTPYGNNGTAGGSLTVGGATDQHGQSSKATTFDGTNDYIDNGSSSTFNFGSSAFTVTGWFKTSTVTVESGSYRTLVSFGGYDTSGWKISLRDDGVMETWWNGSAQTTGSGSKADGSWHSFTYTRSGNTFQLYVDGVVNGSSSTFAGSLGFTKVLIGAGGYSAATQANEGRFNGQISDVRIYNRALSATEITKLYQSYKSKIVANPWDSDAQAFFDKIALSGGTLTYKEKSATNQLVLDLKSNSLWTKMKAVYPFVGGTATTHKYNLKDPRDLDAAFRLTFSGGWTHSSSGADPNGTTGYADTHVVQSTDLATNSASFGIYYNETVTPNDYFEGATGAGTFGTYPLYASYNPDKFIGYISSGYDAYPTTSPTTTSGWRAVSRIDASNTLFGIDGTTSSTSRASSTPANVSFYLGAGNGGGGFVSIRRAFAYLSDGLTLTDLGNMYTVVHTFETTLGR